MQTMKVSDLPAFIKSVALDMDEPLMLWGPPGCGKSAVVAQVAERANAVLVDIRLSQYDSVDLRGFPTVEAGKYEGSGAMAWVPPVTLPFVGNKAFPTDRPIIVFLDEINSASMAVAAVAYQLVNERRVGEHPLMPNVRVLLAGNREGDKGVTSRMPLPLANRMTHVEVIMDHESWIAHHLDNSGDPLMAAFFMYRPALICTFDPAKPAKAFGTYRSWTKAARYVASDMSRSMKYTAVAGAVGDGEAAELFGFMDIAAKMPDLDDVIARPTKAPLPDGVGMSYAVSMALSVRMDADNEQELTAIDTYLRRMPVEFYSLAWTRAIQRENSRYTHKLLASAPGAAYAKTLQDITGR